MKLKFCLAFILALMSTYSFSHTLEECYNTPGTPISYYYGNASCYAGTDGWLNEYVPHSFSSTIWLTASYPNTGSCLASVPHHGTTTPIVEVCTPIEHSHVQVGSANVTPDYNQSPSDRFVSYDSNCSWGSWYYGTGVEAKDLSCNGSKVGTFYKILLNNPVSCTFNAANGTSNYSSIGFGASRCNQVIERIDFH